jgi:hypothetical protein
MQSDCIWLRHHVTGSVRHAQICLCVAVPTVERATYMRVVLGDGENVK